MKTSLGPPYAHLKQQVAFVCIRAYAAHSFLYYVKDSPVISDGDYDALCKFLLENYDWIKPYDLNNYLDAGCLKAGSGFTIAEKVCGQTRDYALDLLKGHGKKTAVATPKAKSKPKPTREVIDEDFDLIG